MPGALRRFVTSLAASVGRVNSAASLKGEDKRRDRGAACRAGSVAVVPGGGRVSAAQPEAEALHVERFLADPAHERMRVLGFTRPCATRR